MLTSVRSAGRRDPIVWVRISNSEHRGEHSAWRSCASTQTSRRHERVQAVLEV